MFEKRWRVGTLFGFPVELNLSFLLLLGVVYLWMGGLAGVFAIGVVFASVLVHELGHAIVARRLGVPIAGIELGFFGGAAKMDGLPRRADHEVAIAAIGPIVSLAVAALGLGLGAVTHSWFLGSVGWINLLLGVFNLLPALPMDGGRILRALLTRGRPYVAATDLAVRIAHGLTLGLAVVGVATGAIQLVVLAPFLWMMSSRERQVARLVAPRYSYDRRGYVERASYDRRWFVMR